MRAARTLILPGLLALAGCAGVGERIDAVAFPEKDVFPESITANATGDLFVGSAANGSIYRVGPGEQQARVWVPAAASGIAEMLGVFADETSNTLYACSIGMNAPPERADALSALHAFTLDTGQEKAKYPLPGGAKAICNDIATDTAGNAYVSETMGGRILVLRKGGAALEEWLAEPRLAGVNGIAVGTDGALYVDSMMSGKLMRIAIARDGPGAVTELALQRPLDRPDGLRALGGNRFLLAENSGRLSLVTVSGDTAAVEPLANGEGWSSAVFARGRYWAVNPKAEYRMDPSLKGKDPGAFRVDAIDPPE